MSRPDVVVAAVLAGGSSSRMGTDKGAVVVGGLSMLERILAALDRAGMPAFLVGGARGISDSPGRAGPLAGLAAALDHAAGDAVFLVAIDQPLLRHETVAHLRGIPEGDIVVPRHDGVAQVTCAIYRNGCREALSRLGGDAAPRDLLDLVSVRYVEEAEWRSWGEDGRSWFSVDRQQDVATAERLMKEGA